MIRDGVWLVLRSPWVQTNKIFKSLTAQESREKLVNIVHHEFVGTNGNRKTTRNVHDIKNRNILLLIPKCILDLDLIAGAGRKVKEAFQTVFWQRQLQREQLFLQVFRGSLHCHHRKLLRPILLFAVSVFKWERDGISDEELLRALAEMQFMKNMVEYGKTSAGKGATLTPEGWELFVDNKDLKVWRCFRPEYNLFEFKAYGTFTDISARAFYDTQMDLRFWCGWEPHTIKVNVIDTDFRSKCEVIHWVYRYPYPMHPRDYCYVRRGLVDDELKKMVIRARAISHPKCPETPPIVRVKLYNSQLVIMPNSSFDENGFSFYLTYFDNPQSRIPNVCYNWLASSGVPGFVAKLHEASKVMQERTKEGYRPNVLSCSFSSDEEKKGQLRNFA